MPTLIHLILFVFFFPTAPACAQTIFPLRAELTEEHGSGRFVISNPTDRTLSVKLDWIDLVALENGTYRAATTEERIYNSAAPYLVLSPVRFKLLPGQRRDLAVTINDRATARPDRELRSHLKVSFAPVEGILRPIANKMDLDMSWSVSVPVLLRKQALLSQAEFGKIGWYKLPNGNIALDIELQHDNDWTTFANLKVSFQAPKRRSAITLSEQDGVALYKETKTRRVQIDTGFASMPKGTFSFTLSEENALSRRLLALKQLTQ